MNEQKNDAMDFVKQEGDSLENDDSIFDIFESKEGEDNPADSSPEEEPNDTNPSQEGEEEAEDVDTDEADNTPDEKPVPFHKHPRWQQREEEMKELRDQIKVYEDQIQPLLDAKENAQPQEVELPEWWKTAMGTDEISRLAYQQKLADDVKREEAILAKITETQQKQAQEEIDAQKYWDDHTEKEMEILKAEGLSFDKNELLKVAVEYQPTGEDGLISLRKAHEIMTLSKQNAKTEKVEEKKKIVANTNSGTNGTSEELATTPNPNTLRGRSFSSLV